MPFPPLDGGAQVMHFTTRGLILNKVVVKTLAINPSRNYIDLNTLPDDYIKSTSFEAVNVDTKIKLPDMLFNLFGRESYFLERFISTEFKKKLESILENDSYDIVQLEHLYLSIYIPVIKKYSKAKILLRPQNIEYIIWERYNKNVRNIFKKIILETATRRLKKIEQGVAERLDGIMALTKEDADIFQSFGYLTPIEIIPMGYDYEKLVGYDTEQQYNNGPVVYHLGSMDWLPNVEAINWFLRKVLPIIEMQHNSAEIIIAGKNMPGWVYQYQSNCVKVQDEVADPLKFQSDKMIMIVPLLSGSGIRAKIIEGLALGKTIISTSIGAQGIEYENGKNMLIADTPEKFAEQIVRCIRSPGLCREIGRNASDLSFRYYHYQNTTQKMIGFYEKVMGINE